MHRPGRGPEVSRERAGQADHDATRPHRVGGRDDGPVVVGAVGGSGQRVVGAGQHARGIGDREADAAFPEVDAQDPRGFGPLHLAALHGLMRVVQKLLRAGADPSQRDTLNRTPREIAVMRGFVDIAAELAPSPAGGGDVSMARFLRDR